MTKALISSANRAKGPRVSKVLDKGTAPVSAILWAEGLKPNMPFNAAGVRIEPPVSPPKAIGLRPLATATAEPEDDPPGANCCSAHGFLGVPCIGF